MQTALSQRADFMVFCSVKGGGTESSEGMLFQEEFQRLFLHPAFFIL